MRGIKIIPHSTLKNDKIKDITKALHKPTRYVERYNFKAIDYVLEEGKPLPINKLFKKGGVKKALTPKTESDLLVLQNNFAYEIEMSNKNVEFRVLSDEIEEVKKIYNKYIEGVKFGEEVKNYNIEIVEDMKVVEMVNKEHFMFSLKSNSNGLEPLRYILDLKRQLRPGEKFIYQVVLHSLDNEWGRSFAEAYNKFKEGVMPKKFKITPKDIVKFGGDITLKVALELFGVVEEIIFNDTELTKIDLTQDSVLKLKKERGLKRNTIEKANEVGFEVGIRGIAYSQSEGRRDFLCSQFKNCFSCLDGDNRLIMREVKNKKNNLNRIKYREIISNIAPSSKMILNATEVSNLLYLPQITLQQEFNVERLDFREIPLPEELQKGDIPIGALYGSRNIKAYWSNIKDVLTLSKVFVGVKGSGKSKYMENYVYHAYKSGGCIIYFDYIENNVNAKEVSKHIPEEDKIILDLSKGFTFDYPELDITTIPRDEEYDRTIKRFSSDYCRLIEKFINTINTEDTSELTGNMRNILVSACSFTFLTGHTEMYSIYKMLTDHKFREEIVKKVKEMNIYREDDFRFDILKSLDIVEVNPKNKREKIIGTNGKADRVLDRFNALMRDSRTEEMLLGINRNNVNFVDIFEQNKVVLVLLPEDYFSDYELKDIVITYFLSRMWLSGLKRAKLIPDRDKRRVVHIMLDEIHQLSNSTSLMIKNIAEDRKFRTTYIFTCQYLKQFGNLWSAVKGSGSHFMLLSGTEKENFHMLREEIGDKFSIEELLNMPPRSSLNIIRYNGQNISTFLTKLPPMLDLALRGINIREEEGEVIREDNRGNKNDIENKFNIKDILINGKSTKFNRK